ncbi:MAG: glutamate racemase [Endomicrobium sp.]|jgi:glutamate racemase|nr:glutamate racemase [Endomicrobium sp.]
MQINQKKKKMIKNNNPIGVFDSGVGGLTVMSEINKILPKENFIYFGDTAHLPYGSKSKNMIIELSKKITLFLIKKDVKLIVVACNTASSFALSILQKTFKIPIVGVIKSTSMAAMSASKKNRIGVIGTEGTVNSKSYINELNKISRYNVYQQACPLFVSLIEEGWTENEITNIIIKKYLKPLLNKNIDTLILGCTHYQLLKKILKKNVKNDVVLIDSSKFVVKEVLNVLNKEKMFAKNRDKVFFKFYVSDNPAKFKKLGNQFFKRKIYDVKKINIDAE